MNIQSKKESFLFACGDIVILYLSLVITLMLRYFAIPTVDILNQHLLPFSILFIFWFFVFFVFGLYEKQIIIDKKRIIPSIAQVQIINSIIAIIFFYFSPITQITPKTNLFIYIFVSVLLLTAWRLIATAYISKKQIPICLIGKGEDVLFLKNDLDANLKGFEVRAFFDLSDNTQDIKLFVQYIIEQNIEYVVLDTKDDSIIPYLPTLYTLMFKGVEFFEVSDLYESLYGRVPLQIVKHGWFLEHVKSKPHMLYDFFKRIMDITVSILLCIPLICIYPFIFILIKLEDKGPILYRDIRIGKNNKIITIFKFRSMSVGIIPKLGKKIETRVGTCMRKTRIDELPQLINVLKGDLSLIGPRPEQPKMVEEYNSNVPFYNVRHLITPGLSGWAQIYHDNHPHHGLDVEATKEKLSYDLYYIKNRSFILDILIALKTIKTIVLHKGK